MKTRGNFRARRRELAAAAEQIQLEGQGVCQVAAYQRDTCALLQAEADLGNSEAKTVLLLVGQFIHQIDSLLPATLCFLCDRAFSSSEYPDEIVVLTAALDRPSVAIVNGLCSECTTMPAMQRKNAVLAKWREAIGGVRELPPMSEPGRA